MLVSTDRQIAGHGMLASGWGPAAGQPDGSQEGRGRVADHLQGQGGEGRRRQARWLVGPLAGRIAGQLAGQLVGQLTHGPQGMKIKPWWSAHRITAHFMRPLQY